ncbi:MULTISPECIES: xanthine dehydrogenase family protein molybdopterin-binding subunit [Rhizobium]|uniref:xanthine dehydrogenase family protein molybdopterin-binding subunit n=1 Tax=Rhizobium TaxID=379 RepID=UPI001C82FDFB|nr:MULTISPECIES: molybdopterin cofactor-binding domain-containing protein [Rhizobium]MBX4899719.1 xanthine dehydrogenase family protein molybdopterin-binding subunit [Rhizobium bangladeshense]MBX5297621.1 xanthine dehydrogenase family protein molybdopterin-binding subunit [Rhizobium sp. NLR15a]MBY3617889.1 xanthine dehydrogenase family protein molybdopterin-binding subunit [Rhizobium bangladeshense]
MSTPATNLSRRTVLQAMLGAGGGLVIGFHVPVADAATVASKPWTTPGGGVEINAWLTIDTDGTVTIRVPHTELGQGALTSVSMMVAEELDVPWAKVRAVFADMNRHVNGGEEYVETSTNGSRVVRSRHPHIMLAGAFARERLKQAAAEAWGVDRSAVQARQGILSSDGREATYAEFAGAAAAVTLDREPVIKAPGDWWLLGTPVPRLDVPVKVNGSAHYAIDTRLDGMAYAAVRSCPVPWGRLVGFDAAEAERQPGVLAVVEFRAAPGKGGPNHLQDGIAVVADSYYRAMRALSLVRTDWDFGAHAGINDETQAQEAAALLETPGEVTMEQGGDAPALIAASTRVVTADYHRPYETHARMEPINATVSVTDTRVDVWSPTQNQATALEIVADELGRSTRGVHVHTVFIGGAFGANGGGNTAVTRQAAVLSARLRRPVKVIWSREEDIAQDKQRAPHYIRLSASIGEGGLPDAFFSRAVWFAYKGAASHGSATADYAIANMPYGVASRRHERHNANGHIPTATHRAPGANQNGFIIEQFVDEVALAGGWDPLEWRLEMTRGMEPWQRVLAKLKDVSGFTTGLQRGRGMGVAVVAAHGSYCGACATVEVSREGALRIERLVLVMNSGYIINPLNATEQMEGSACWELTHALQGGLALSDGRFTNLNFDTYPLLRMDQMPKVECHFALSKDGWWGGVAEPAAPPVPPAIANAIYFATGKRIRSTPIVRHDLSWS